MSGEGKLKETDAPETPVETPEYEVDIHVFSENNNSGKNDVGVVVPPEVRTMVHGQRVRIANASKGKPQTVRIWFPRPWNAEGVEVVELGKNDEITLTVDRKHFTDPDDHKVPYQVYCVDNNDFAVAASPPRFVVNAP